MHIVYNTMQFEMPHMGLFIWHLSRVMSSNNFDIMQYVFCIICCSQSLLNTDSGIIYIYIHYRQKIWNIFHFSDFFCILWGTQGIYLCDLHSYKQILLLET